MVQTIKQANKNTLTALEQTSTNALIEKISPTIEHKNTAHTESVIADLLPKLDLANHKPEVQKAKTP
jgi:hypothetical protein